VARRGSLLTVGAGLAGALLLLAIARRGGSRPAELESLAAEFDAQIRETAAAAQARAVTLAELPRLAWAVATDEATVRNMTGEELAFRPQPNETIEIGQIDRHSKKEMTLLRAPVTTQVHAPLRAPGMHLLVVGGQLQLVAVMNLEPKVHANVMLGAVSVARQVDLSRIEKHVRDLGLALRYDCAAGNTIAIGSDEKGSLHPFEMPLTNDAARGGKFWIMAPERPPQNGPLTAAAVLVLLGSFTAGGLLWRVRPPTVQNLDGDAPTSAEATAAHIATAWSASTTAPRSDLLREDLRANPLSPIAPSQSSAASSMDDLPLSELVPESRSAPVPASVILRLTPPVEKSTPPSRPPRFRTEK
jgi:hypothetical protein